MNERGEVEPLGDAGGPYAAPRHFDSGAGIGLCIAAALIMGMGWGIRGAYGHTSGAAMPGALVAMVVGLCAMRPDWWRRVAIFGLAGGVGWSFGGQASYGILVGYTTGDYLPSTYYGFACLFVVGALWGGIGAGFLGIAMTSPRSFLSALVGPLLFMYCVWFLLDKSGVLEDWTRQLRELTFLKTYWIRKDGDEVPSNFLASSYWVKAGSALVVGTLYWVLRRKERSAARFLILLAVGWWLGMLLLIGVLGLRMTPPRSDGWAGCLGVWLALLFHFSRTDNRAARMLSFYGLLAGGIGFACGDFVQMLGRARWGPIGQYEFLLEADYWTAMEKTFGFVMGWGVGLGALRLVRSGLAVAPEDQHGSCLNEFSVFYLLVVIPWVNLKKNVLRWVEGEHIPSTHFGLPTTAWAVALALLPVGLLLYHLYRHRRSTVPLLPSTALGKAQLLFVFLLGTLLLGYMMGAIAAGAGPKTNIIFFWLMAVGALVLVLRVQEEAGRRPSPDLPASDATWKLGPRHWLLWLAVPLFLLFLARLTMMHGLDPQHYRFEPPAASSEQPGIR